MYEIENGRTSSRDAFFCYFVVFCAIVLCISGGSDGRLSRRFCEQTSHFADSRFFIATFKILSVLQERYIHKLYVHGYLYTVHTCICLNALFHSHISVYLAFVYTLFIDGVFSATLYIYLLFSLLASILRHAFCLMRWFLFIRTCVQLIFFFFFVYILLCFVAAAIFTVISCIWMQVTWT